MKRLICLVCCSLFFLTACGEKSYMEELDSSEQTSENIEDVDEADAETAQVSQEQATIFVQVAGAVNEPGVFEVSSDTRVFQLIEKAGGLKADADDSDLNLAGTVADGDKIYVYSKGEKESQMQQEEAADDGLININTASAEELETLPGIGQSKANLIISYRQTNGDFNSIEDIKNVSGIGDGVYAQIQALIRV